jgi:hypothetical protein
MNEVRIRMVAVAILSGAMLVAGCKSSTPAPAPSTAAPAGTAAATPNAAQPNGAAPAPGAAPVVAGPAAPTPPPPITAPVGTPVEVRLTETLDTKTDDVGSHFSGVLERPMMVHQQILFGKGTPVSGEVVAAKGKGRFKGAGDLGIELTSIDRVPVHTSEFEAVAKGEGRRTGAAVGGGAGLGALIGGLAGHGKGAIIGGLAGAGAGTAVAATGRRDVEIHSETVITFRLTEPVSR